MTYASRKGAAAILSTTATLAVIILAGCQLRESQEGPDSQGLESQEGTNALAIGHKFSLFSETLGEEREYLIYLPKSYDSKLYAPQHYPVLYLLDGGPHFPSVSGVVDFMSSGINANRQIPELIVVAIPNTNRTRDLTPTHTLVGLDGKEAEFRKESGGGNAFLQFIRDELFAEVDSKFRSLPHRTIVGHSLGGLLALHALVEHPDMFQGYIAIDPSLWWDEQLVVRRAEQVFSIDRSRRGSVYISLANHEAVGPGHIMDVVGREFSGILGTAVGIRSELQHFEAEDHASVALLSLYHGLLSIFDGYKIPFDVIAERPMEVVSHFERMSDRLGFPFVPPEPLVNISGYTLLRSNGPEKALELFEINAANYPSSFNVYDALADAYAVMGDKILAIENYEKSLSLNPEYEEARRKISELKE